MQYLSFWVWLISLSIMPSRSIYVITNDKISFFFKAEYYSIYIYIYVYVCVCVCVYHILVIYLSMGT